ncbi:hypothetical protein GOODEAATRI_028367 [Goodea atripinnis]|uniref:Uncharacterized protein n=1 Tax=Goodea atripinnis TaxID=208336 RepID=A0ABV0NGN6_9TELE
MLLWVLLRPPVKVIEVIEHSWEGSLLFHVFPTWIMVLWNELFLIEIESGISQKIIKQSIIDGSSLLICPKCLNLDSLLTITLIFSSLYRFSIRYKSGLCLECPTTLIFQMKHVGQIKRRL